MTASYRPSDPWDDLARGLRGLLGLREAGVLSAQEYEAKRADLLGRP